MAREQGLAQSPRPASGVRPRRACCDPNSDDLQTDSAYRISRAYLDTARGDFQRVLQILGGNEQEVPGGGVARRSIGALGGAAC